MADEGTDINSEITAVYTQYQKLENCYTTVTVVTGFDLFTLTNWFQQIFYDNWKTGNRSFNNCVWRQITECTIWKTNRSQLTAKHANPRESDHERKFKGWTNMEDKPPAVDVCAAICCEKSIRKKNRVWVKLWRSVDSTYVVVLTFPLLPVVFVFWHFSHPTCSFSSSVCSWVSTHYSVRPELAQRVQTSLIDWVWSWVGSGLLTHLTIRLFIFHTHIRQHISVSSSHADCTQLVFTDADSAPLCIMGKIGQNPL